MILEKDREVVCVRHARQRQRQVQRQRAMQKHPIREALHIVSMEWVRKGLVYQGNSSHFFLHLMGETTKVFLAG